MVLQTGGNLVAYNPDDAVRWATSSGDKSVAWLAVRDDGSLVLQSREGQVRWQLDPVTLAVQGAAAASTAGEASTVAVGATLVASGGHPSVKANPQTTESWQWYRDSAPIDGATAKAYTVTEEDLGAKISATAITQWPSHYTAYAGSAERTVTSPSGADGFQMGISAHLGHFDGWGVRASDGKAIQDIALDEFGADSLRDELFWSELGDTDANQNAARVGPALGRLDTVTAQGGKLLMILDYNHPQRVDASKDEGFPATPEQREAFANYALRLIERIGPENLAGVEVWNEWDIFMGWSGSPGAEQPVWNTPCPLEGDDLGGCPILYAKLVEALVNPASQGLSSQSLREAAPGVPIIVGATSSFDPQWTRPMLEYLRDNGVAVDGYSTHPYAAAAGNGCPVNWVTTPQDEGMAQCVKGARERVADWYGQDLPIYVTELGVTLGDPQVTPELQAERLVKSYVRTRAVGNVGGIWWYDLFQDYADGANDWESGYGLINRVGSRGEHQAGTTRPAGDAYGALAGFWRGCEDVQGAVTGTTYYRLTCANATPAGTRHVFLDASLGQLRAAQAAGGTLVDLLGVKGELSPGAPVTADWAGREVGVYGATADSFALRLSGQAYRGQTVTVVADSAATGLVGIDEYRWESKSGGGDWAQAAYAPADRTSPSYRIGGPDGTGWDDFQGTSGYGKDFRVQAIKDGEVLAEVRFRTTRSQAEGSAASAGVTSPVAGAIRISGDPTWAFDWAQPSQPGRLYVSVGAPCGGAGATGFGPFEANQHWPAYDAELYPQIEGGLHGFDLTFETGLYGTQPVYIYAVPVAWQPSDGCAGLATTLGSGNGTSVNLGAQPQVSEGLSAAAVTDEPDQPANYGLAGTEPAAWGAQTITVALRDSAGRPVTDAAAKLTVRASVYDPAAGAGLGFSDEGRFRCAAASAGEACPEGDYAVDVYSAVALTRQLEVDYVDDAVSFVVRNADGSGSRVLAARFVAAPASGVNSDLSVDPLGVVMAGQSFRATVQVRDAAGQPRGGDAVTFSLTGDECVAGLSAASGASGQSGQTGEGSQTGQSSQTGEGGPDGQTGEGGGGSPDGQGGPDATVLAGTAPGATTLTLTASILGSAQVDITGDAGVCELTATVGGQGVGASPVVLTWSATADGNATIRETVAGSAPFAVTLDEPLTWSFTADFTAGTGAGSGAGSAASLAASPAGSQAAPAASLVLRTTRDDGIVQSWKAVRGDPSDGGETGEEAVFTVTIPANALEPGYYDVEAGLPGAAQPWTGSVVVVDGPVDQDLTRRFGVDAGLSWSNPERTLAQIGQEAEWMQVIGLGSVRDRYSLAQVQSAGTAACAGDAVCIDNVDRVLNQDGGLDVVTVSSSGVARTSIRAPYNLDDAFAQGQAFATKMWPQVTTVEVANEPILPGFFSGYPFQYASALKAFSAGVKSVHPEMRVLTGSHTSMNMEGYQLSSWWGALYEQETLANNTAGSFDARNEHWYPRSPYYHNNGWFDVDKLAGAVPSVDVGTKRAVDQDAGIGDKPIWVTELADSFRPQSTGFDLDYWEAKQAALVAQSYAAALGSGAERVYAFYWQTLLEQCDSGVTSTSDCLAVWGLTRNAYSETYQDGRSQALSPRPALAATAALIRHVQDKQVVKVETSREVAGAPWIVGTTVYFSDQTAVTWDGSKTLADFGPGATAKNMYGRPVADLAPARTADVYYAPYLVSGVTSTGDGAVSVTVPGADAEPADAVSSGAEFRLGAGGLKINGEEPLQRKAYTNPATNQDDRDSTIGVKVGDVLTLDVQARAGAQNQNVAAATEFACQAGPGIEVDRAASGMVGSVYRCQFEVVGDVPARAQAYRDGVYSWTVPGFVSATATWQGLQDVVRVGLTHRAEGDFEVVGTPYIGQTMTVRTDLTGIAAYRWYDLDSTGSAALSSGGDYAGPNYLVTAADFNGTEGRRITVMAYDAAGQVLAQAWFQPTQVRLKGWIAANDLTSPAEGQVRINQAWAFDWQDLGATSRMVATVGATCANASAAQRYGFDSPYLANRAWPVAGEWYPGVVGGTYWFTGVDIAVAQRGEQPVYLYAVPSDWDGTCGQAVEFDGGGKAKGLYLGDPPWSARLVSPGWSAPADGSARLTVVTQVVDAAGAALTGVEVLFQVPEGVSVGATGGPTVISALTDGLGAARLMMTSQAAGSYEVRATIDGVAVVDGSPAVAVFTAEAPPSRGAAKADRRSQDSADPRVGVSVAGLWEPGFFDASWGPYMQADPWAMVKQHTPERQPELGWYNQLDPTVAEQQLAWMADYGIDYTSYLWLWNPDGESKSAASIDAYLAAPSQSELAFSLLWDFGESIEELTLEDWRGIVDGWLDRYLTRPEYLRIDGQPVVSLHGSADGLLDWASGQAEVLYPEAEYVRDGVTYSASPDARPKYFLVLQDLNAIADQAAVARGLAGMFLSSGFTTNTTAHWNMVSALARFDGDSPYNYHSAPTAAGEQEVYSHTFAELAGFYAQQWSAGIDAPFLDNADPADATQKRIVPITSGWDATPLTANGSPGIYADAAHNGSRSTPAQFEAHLGEARQFMAAHPGETLGLGRIYAWNEFMEGGMVEPTVQEGKAYLEAISRVFGRLETSTDRWEAPSGAGAMVVGVETDLRTWTVESSASWLTLGVASGSYDGEFAVVAAPNPTGQARQGVLTVTAGGIVREIEVSQAAGTALDVAASGFTVSGDPVFADGSATGAVTVALVGTDGAPWTGPVALVGSGGALSELSVGSFVHIGAGIHLARFTGTEVGDWPVAVTADGAALGVADGGNATARLVLGPVGFAAGQTQLVAPEGTAFADGSASLTLAAEVVDTSGRPMPGVSVLFNLPSGLTAGATGGEASVGVTSDPSGAARLTVTSLAAGVYWVTASVGGVAVVEGSPAAVEFTEVPAVPPVLDPARSSFTVSAGEVVADGEASGLVTVALVGSDGHPWAGDAALAGSGAAPSGLWVGPFSHLGAGIHMAPFRGTEVGDWAVSVTADGVALAVAQGGNGTARLVVGPPAFGPGLTRLVAPVGSARVDEPTGLTASVVVADSLGRPVPGVEVVFALPSGLAVGSTGGPATVSAWSGPDGVASVSVTASIPGVYPVTAMVGGVPVVEGSPALAEFTAVPDEPDQAPRAPAVDASNGRQVTGAVHEDDLDSAAGSALAVVAAATATGDELGRCQVAVDGSFGCPLPGLDHGTSVTVWLEDLAGNASPGVVVVVDAVAPAPVVVRPSDGRELVGTGEQPGDRVTVAAADARELCSAVIAEDLSWACALAPPAEVGAVVTVVVTDPAGNAAEIAWRIGVPQVTVDRASVSPGDTLTVTGVDFQPGETVTAVMWSDPVLVGQVTVGAEGSLRLSWVIPDSTEAGEHQVTLTGGLSGAWSAAFEVRGSGPTPTPTESATAPSADPSSPAPTGSPTASEPTTPDPTQSQTQGAPGGPAPTASSTGSTGATANPTASGGNGEDLPRTGPSLTGPLVALALGMILVGACGLVFSARRRRLNRGRFRG
ncbi:MAG: Ig-like domain-containing protein [Bifidobacteriaceae bacterium]|nr:Ig-like domain-containing protein [Bifidobacteriaceae bacterium]